MTDRQQRKTRGWLYLTLVAAVFAGTVALPESECRLVADGRLTDDCISHVSNSGQIAAMFAAVYAVIDPRAFIAVFGRFIRAVMRIWAHATGRTFVEIAAPSTKAAISTRPQRRARRGLRQRIPVRRAAGLLRMFAGYVSPPAVVVVILVLAVPALMLLPRVRPSAPAAPIAGGQADPVTPPQSDVLGSPPQRVVPKTYAIASGDTCISIATQFCMAARWREFAADNAIRIFQRGSVELCDLQPGAVYETPLSWREPGCF